MRGLLLQAFDRFAQAPGGVARLRELILSLAVRGKLVPQDPADEPASMLLQRIRAEKERLIEDGKAKPLLPIADDEKQFAVPEGWSWTRLREVVVSSEAGWSPSCLEAPRREGRWGVLKVSAVSWGSFDSTANKELPQELDPRPELEVRDGDFLLSRANTAELVARSVLVVAPPPMLMLSDKIIRLKLSPRVDTCYINLFNNGNDARIYYAERASGTSSSMKNVSREVVLGLPVALPPLAEQARIVARVDELMRLCDALEAKGRLEAEQHTRLLDTLLGTLIDSATPEELAANWQRVAEHFDLLLDRPEAVDALEQTILQLAVRGLLVSQTATDESASALIDRIRVEKDRLARKGDIKLFMGRAVVSENDQPCVLPNGWEWARVGSLGITSTGGTPPTSRPEFFGNEIAFIGPGQISTSGEILPSEKYISELGRLETSIAEPGDLLMVCIGGSIGKCAVAHETIAFNQQINSIRFLFGSSTYLLIAMTSLDFQRQVLAAATGSATPIISKGKWETLLIPIPPRSEQDRIVARVAELRRFCTELRQRLSASQATQSRLAEALVESAAE